MHRSSCHAFECLYNPFPPEVKKIESVPQAPASSQAKDIHVLIAGPANCQMEFHTQTADWITLGTWDCKTCMKMAALQRSWPFGVRLESKYFGDILELRPTFTRNNVVKVHDLTLIDAWTT